ncbi:hypothetical protein [Bacillus sp. FJAT-44742]|uniref:hypothetical protein n=1 Tax=Bacillus sp. FJAT-44742 TaxID=2014005 RepID=UPI000C23E76E|nr:hypothetical protein [Bacillus sp. FJAT-44742]
MLNFLDNYRLRIIVRWIKIKHYVTPFLLGLIIISFISVLLFIINNFFGVPVSDPGLAGLIGAVLGGALTFYGSLYVHNKQLKSAGAVRREKDIYSPLFEEIQTQVKRNKESLFLIFDFDKWDTITSGAMSIEIPRFLKVHGYDELLKRMEEWQTARSELGCWVSKKIVTIIKENNNDPSLQKFFEDWKEDPTRSPTIAVKKILLNQSIEKEDIKSDVEDLFPLPIPLEEDILEALVRNLNLLKNDKLIQNDANKRQRFYKKLVDLESALKLLILFIKKAHGQLKTDY